MPRGKCELGNSDQDMRMTNIVFIFLDLLPQQRRLEILYELHMKQYVGSSRTCMVQYIVCIFQC